MLNREHDLKIISPNMEIHVFLTKLKIHISLKMQRYKKPFKMPASTCCAPIYLEAAFTDEVAGPFGGEQLKPHAVKDLNRLHDLQLGRQGACARNMRRPVSVLPLSG